MLPNWFAEIARNAPQKRFLLCLDEFERLSEVVAATNSRAPLNFLRYVIQNMPQWILLFSGSHTPNELDAYWSDYLINTRSLRVSYLDESSARDLILSPVEEFPEIYEPEAVDAIIKITRCQPYLVQLICTVLVDYLNQDNRRKVTREDVDYVIPKAIEVGERFFDELWRINLSTDEQDLLLRLVSGEVPSKNDGLILRKLRKKEILEIDSYQFQVPLIQKYIQGLVI